MGALFSFFGAAAGEEETDGRSLLALLDDDDDADAAADAVNLDWQAIQQRLHAFPEEAAAYCHFYDASPLMRCLMSRRRRRRQQQQQQLPPPVEVVQAFLDAYNESVYHTDRNGVTPLLAFVQAAAAAAAAAAAQAVNRDVDDDDDNHVDTNEVQIAQLLVQANHLACSLPDRQGRLPLHFAVCAKNYEMFQLLLQAYPHGAEQMDSMGRLPLHYSCLQLAGVEPNSTTETTTTTRTPMLMAVPDLNVIQLLLKACSKLRVEHGGILLKDKEGHRPLDIIYREINSLLLLPEEEMVSSSMQTKLQVERLWEIMTLLVKTATISCATATSAAAAAATTTTDQQQHEPAFRLVHALVALGGCPTAVLMEALKRHPQQAIERDEAGRTPLLIAAATSTASTTEENMFSLDPVAICQLVQCNPAAARMTDNEGRLPIDLFAEKGAYNEQLFEALVMAEPRAVDTRDLKYGQHPFLTAALAGENSNVSSVYHLLRAKPHVIAYYNLS